MLSDRQSMVARIVEAAEPRVSVFSSAPAPSPARAPAADAKARIAAILGHAAAQGRRALAEKIALETDLSAEAAAGILAAVPKEAAAPSILSIAERSESMGVLGALGQPRASADPTKPADYNAAWDRVIERVNVAVRARKAQQMAG